MPEDWENYPPKGEVFHPPYVEGPHDPEEIIAELRADVAYLRQRLDWATAASKESRNLLVQWVDLAAQQRREELEARERRAMTQQGARAAIAAKQEALALMGPGRCRHYRTSGVYGDEIMACGYRRLQCVDCGKYRPGEVSEATVNRVTGDSHIDIASQAIARHPVYPQPAKYASLPTWWVAGGIVGSIGIIVWLLTALTIVH